MMTDTTKLTLLVFVEGLGVPVRDVVSAEWGPWYEEIVERLVLADGDALDVINAHMNTQDRALILRAGNIVRRLSRPITQEE